MGSAFALWDWMFGTPVIADEKKELVPGTDEEQNRRFTTFTANVLMPFVDTWQKITGLPQTIRKLAANRK